MPWGDIMNGEELKDDRSPPDKRRLRAFKTGWTDATKEEPEWYETNKEKRTHQNMGNLFGWVYGEASNAIKEKVWEQYVEINKELGKDW
uniref:Uncharacterized protein n=1 Tax=uncultured organism TaxID=155900 RepID=M1QAW0_9ZZZZ|nr:hypothetical protein FLSS-17_0021 [uncultured organism]